MGFEWKGNWDEMMAGLALKTSLPALCFVGEEEERSRLAS